MNHNNGVVVAFSQRGHQSPRYVFQARLRLAQDLVELCGRELVHAPPALVAALNETSTALAKLAEALDAALPPPGPEPPSEAEEEP